MGDNVFNEIFHPISVKFIDRCDAVFRIGGASSGADEMVRTARDKEKIVFFEKSQVPNLE